MSGFKYPLCSILNKIQDALLVVKYKICFISDTWMNNMEFNMTISVNCIALALFSF